ncbi:Short chain dehydrogenase-like protein 64 [Elsinoe fawcettii]|nr:Short chain dehydrogenase-like protein 64 [Elsinoe fawcettii]
MIETQKTAYVTGGASGIGRAVVHMLVMKGIKTAIADINFDAAKAYAKELNDGPRDVPSSSGPFGEGLATAVSVDVASWDSQLEAFQTACSFLGGRVDYVFAVAGIGERPWLPPFDPANIQDSAGQNPGFVKPDLTTLNVDLNGPLYTAALAIQQMRSQKPSTSGFRGSIAIAASVCGFYCVPTLPIYTAAKHGVIGFVRTYGKLLAEFGIGLNAQYPVKASTNKRRRGVY